ncbi:hypothetical protein [Microcoleus sp. CAWBG58]|uniref:hypothetical protein n=1 Tax=Microcoleus sp. CAWBG58 TaxID=2841651 RepID=UPI0025F178A0|nr:hypothetical protein [Microcoleus sp. CAWBG58]
MLLRLSALSYIDERALKRNYVPRLKSIDDRFWFDRNDLTAEGAENTERDKRDEYWTMLPDLI